MTQWIEWYAHKNQGRFEGPLPDNALVQYMMIDGEVDMDPASELNWGLVDQAGEIIAYRQIGFFLHSRVRDVQVHQKSLNALREQFLRK